jgi:hypothetical protein
MYSSATTDAGGFVFAIGNGDEAVCSEAREQGVLGVAGRMRWSAERTLALPGRCRGSVLARWAENLARRFGPRAVDRVRAGLPEWEQDLPDDPSEEHWFPVGLQLRLTELVIDELLGGDALALEPLLAEDVKRTVSRATALFLRTVGPVPILGRAKQIHPSLYDVGKVSAEVVGTRATVRCDGAALFGHPTWSLLQLFAHRGFIQLTGRRTTHLGLTTTSETSARIDLSWI